MNDNISEKDKKDWDLFINSNEKLPNKDFKHQKNKNLKIRSIDLHGYALDEANKTIENFINKAFSDNINKLIIVTGKGLHSENEKDPYVSKDLGILKYSVPEYIKSSKDLMNLINDIQDAKVSEGGSGAFCILLKKKKLQNKF